MRILVAAIGVESHLRALAPVAQAAATLGHDVVVATAPTYAQTVDRYGLRHVPAGMNWTDNAAVGPRLAEALRQGNETFCKVLIAEYLAGPAAERTANDIVKVAHDWRPDVMLRDVTDVGAQIAAARLGMRCIDVENGFADLMARLSPADQPIGPELLSPAPTDLLLHDLPGTHPIEYRHEHPARGRESYPAWMARLPTDRPLIYVALGSILTCAPGLSRFALDRYAPILEALAKIDCSAVVSLGDRSHIERFDVPDHIRLVARTPQPLILGSNVDAFVTHAGFGSIREAIASAVPMVFAPICSDQPANAQRLTELGLGVTLEPEADADAIRQAIELVLGDSSYNQTARYWQRRALGLPPLDAVLERVLGSSN